MDKELPGEEYRQIETHMRACLSCQERLEQWQRMSRSLFSQAQVPASEAFVQKVMERLGAQAEPASGMGWWVPAFGLAAAVLLFFSMPKQESPISAESLLLVNGHEQAISWVFEPAAPAAEEMLGTVLEED